ncbi:MAG: hypothetical protein D8H97_21690 [Neisseria sp.]|nr:MAG: hypothetical protein D8H97_21690 [Neisseria sp.]
MSKVRDVRWNGRAYDAGNGVRDNSLPVSSAAIIADGVVDPLAKRYPNGSDERMAWEIQSRILRGVSNKQQWVFEGLKYSDERKEMTALVDRMIERSPISLDGVDEEGRRRIDALRGAIERERESLKRLHDKKFTLVNVVVNHEGYLDTLPDDMRDAANRYVDTIGAIELNQEATDERAARMEEAKNDDRFVFVRDKAFKASRSPLYNAIFNLGVFRKGFKCVMGGAIYLKPYSLMVVAFDCSGYKVGRRTADVYVVMSFRVDGLDVSESTSMDAAIDKGSEFKLIKVVDSLSGGVESALAMYALDFEKQNPI